MYTIEVPARKIGIFLITIALVLSIISIGGKYIEDAANVEEPHVLSILVRTFNINRESSIPTWYASSLLLLASGVSGLVAMRSDRQKLYWRGLSAIFLYLSIDEAAVLHEKLTIPLQESLGATGPLYFSWVIVGLPVALVVGVIYLRFLLALPARYRVSIFASGVCYVGAAIGIEAIGANQWYLNGGSTLTYSAIGTVEEFFEMVGVILYIAVVLDYLAHYAPKVEIRFLGQPQPSAKRDSGLPLQDDEINRQKERVYSPMVKSAKLMDGLSLLFSIAIVGMVSAWMLRNGISMDSLSQDSNLSWHLIRSTGITAYILMTLSIIWGLALSSRVVKDWSPGIVSMLLHSTVSWLSVAFSAVHALLLLGDKYFEYRIQDILVPFIGPYRPIAVGMGVLAFWVSLIVALSFSMKKQLGQKWFKMIHFMSYIGFVMVTIHGIMAGTDASHLGFRVLLTGSVLLVVIFLGYRVGKGQALATQRTRVARASTRR